MSDESEAVDRFGLEGTVLCGRIEVRYLVAEGGFGLVYRARHVEKAMDVALKVLLPPPDMSPAQLDEFVINFAMEARTLERIQHPNIVGVVEAGEAVMPSGHHTGFLALEWIDGVVLEDELEPRRGRGGRGPAEVFSLMRGVLDALATVHKLGIAHRDLKPGNIMIAAGPDGPLVRLLDFGIAKWMRTDERAGSGRTRTFSNLQAYSPQYAAPEQLTGARTGPWTDVHAVALILTELLTDEPPLEGSTFPQLLASAMNPKRPSPAQHNVDVGAWEPVLRKALSIRPDDRFRDAGELLAALESTLPQAVKRPLVLPDPDDPALARTLTSSLTPASPGASSQPPTKAPSQPPAKAASQPGWLRAPQRPGASEPPGTRPATASRPSEAPVILSASMNPGEMPRPSTPIIGVPMPGRSLTPQPPRPADVSTLPPPKRPEMTAPYRAASSEPRRSNVSNVRTALVVLAGIVVGVVAAVGIAFAFGLFERPAPTPRVIPHRAPRVDAVATVPRALDAGVSVDALTRTDAATLADARVGATDATAASPDATAASPDAASAADATVATDPGADDDATPERTGRRHRRHRRHHRR